jgi:glycosyltransferase involved in cell wall biosynthesis
MEATSTEDATLKRPQRRKRIAIVGPVDPFRGGIAKHTTQVALALNMRSDIEVCVFSFRSLYPKRLFPGKNERCDKARAPENLDARYMINTVNPLSWLRAVHEIRDWRADEVIIPAWTFFVAPCLGVIARMCKRNGAAIAMIVHNVADHEEGRWKAWFSNFQIRAADRFLTHGTALADALSQLGLSAPIHIRPHPIFEQYPDATGALPPRAPLELLYIGFVRPYKGVDIAIRGLAASRRRDVRLSIVGEFWEGRADTDALIEQLGLSDLVEVVDRYVSDGEAAEYFARADAVILPYRSASGSGVVPLAYRYGVPVIVSDLPGLTEVVYHGKTGWIAPVGSPKAIAELLNCEVTREAAAGMRSSIAQACREMSWDRFVECLYREPSTQNYAG